ncbi:5-bromo-4-chloroindolyl phosphate hydrolysis family protein [Wohlfahrtiimonas chitiniclastica]|uniref:5-bromo-4-chloroindolyl phosphate hydrolysis family protein n=2 Tax=Wohlfahrtiimonas chitiniclastica TaxID=400946 RepID=UPI001FF028A7|nr:5-bromo-4-chloroindolyl phosphate hydrolysis family protein [Wohlfahrtiimonas chitiniclastica]
MMSYQESDLPFQRKTHIIEVTSVDTQDGPILRQEEIDFSEALVKGAKTTAKRMLFHTKAFLGGITAQVLKLFIPSSIDPFYGATFLCSYLGILSLFPLRKNHTATLLGLIVALATVLGGLWPVALLFGGLTTTIIDLFDKETRNTGFWFTIPLSLLALAFASIHMPESIFSAMPIWTYGSIAMAIGLGVLKPKALKHLANLALMNEDEKRSYLESIQMQAAAKIAKANAEKEERSYAIFARHIEMLRLIEEHTTQLPNDLSIVVESIGTESVDILKIMQRDPRDVIAGGQFLNRYLPLIHQSLVRYSTIKSLHDAQSIEMDIDAKTLQSLRGIQQAFVQIKKQLADNDVDDLKVDLNVMDKLIRAQGFEIKE